MAQVIADRRDIDFVLHEQLKVEELSNTSALPSSTARRST
jgi:hypothetical protein